MNQARIAAIVVAVALVALGAVQAANAETLGLSQQSIAWLGILTMILGAIQGFLPQVHRRGR